MEQYLGLTEGMSAKVAGRMLTLAGDLCNDVMALREDGLDPRHDRASLTSLARQATRLETQLAQLLVLAAGHCGESELADLPEAIRGIMKTAGRLRSTICLLAMTVEEQGASQQLAA